MAKTRTMPWDPIEGLETAKDIVVYLEIVVDEGDLRLLKAVLGDILIAIKRYGIALEDMVRERERLVIRRPDILKYMDRIIVKSYEVSFAKS